MSNQQVRILLVEDDHDHAELVLGLLEGVRRPAVEAVRVESVEEAVARLRGGSFDAVLLDQKLPDSDFWETVPRVVEAAPRLPILVLTSLNDLDLALEAVNQGAQDYLVKSELAADGLMRALRYAIERKRYVAAAEESRTTMALFAQAVAHEIKAPLGAARLQLDLARAELADAGENGKARHHLERAEEMVVRTTSLVADLLNFDVVAAGTDPVSVEEVLREALDELEPDITATAARIEFGEMPTLQADRSKLRQLFVNLIANALKYGRSGEPPSIAVSAVPDGTDAWTFSVTDRGVGMEADDLERVFGLFQRGRGLGDHPGSGLGLALCRQIVEGHGGRIWAESRVGEGASIRFTLPCVARMRSMVADGIEEVGPGV